MTRLRINLKAVSVNLGPGRQESSGSKLCYVL